MWTGHIFPMSNLYRTGKFITVQLRWQNPSRRVNDAHNLALFMLGPLGAWHYKMQSTATGLLLFSHSSSNHVLMLKPWYT